MRVLLAPAVTSSDRSTSAPHIQNLCDLLKFILTINVVFHLLPNYPSSHYNIYITLLIAIFLLSLRQGVPQ